MNDKWEIAKLGIEGSFDNEKYQVMYNGKVWQKKKTVQNTEESINGRQLRN